MSLKKLLIIPKTGALSFIGVAVVIVVGLMILMFGTMIAQQILPCGNAQKVADRMVIPNSLEQIAEERGNCVELFEGYPHTLKRVYRITDNSQQGLEEINQMFVQANIRFIPQEVLDGWKDLNPNRVESELEDVYEDADKAYISFSSSLGNSVDSSTLTEDNPTIGKSTFLEIDFSVGSSDWKPSNPIFTNWDGKILP